MLRDWRHHEPPFSLYSTWIYLQNKLAFVLISCFRHITHFQWPYLWHNAMRNILIKEYREYKIKIIKLYSNIHLTNTLKCWGKYRFKFYIGSYCQREIWEHIAEIMSGYYSPNNVSYLYWWETLYVVHWLIMYFKITFKIYTHYIGTTIRKVTSFKVRIKFVIMCIKYTYQTIQLY